MTDIDTDPSPATILALDSMDGDALLADFDAWRVTSWAIQDTLERVQPDLRSDSQPINHAIRCLSCRQTGVEFLGDPNHPPDPDRHGNRRHTYRCPGCGEKVTLLTARHGGTRVTTPGFELAD